jgi:hypothetical protein
MKKHNLAQKLIGFTLILFMMTVMFSMQISAASDESIDVRSDFFGSAAEDTLNYNNVTVMNKAVTVENLVVWGNLTVDRIVGSGHVVFKNVKVKGNIFVYGGNTVDFVDVTAGSLTVNKTNNSGISINISGASSIDEITVKAGAEINAPKIKLSSVTLTSDISTGTKVYLDVNGAKELTVDSAGVNLIIDSRNIDNLIITKKAAGSLIEITKGSVVSRATVNAICTIKGAGVLSAPQINASGANVTVSAGKTAPISSASYSGPAATVSSIT